MFYSPWDTDCIRTVDLLETVAKTFIDNDVYFAAVNCWEPKGWYKTSLKMNFKPNKHELKIS